MTLETARKKVADWATMIDAGKDPAVEEQRKQRETQRKQKNTFAAVAEDFIARRVIGPNPERPLQRNGPLSRPNFATCLSPCGEISDHRDCQR